MEPNKSGLTTIGVPGQGISASSCDNKNIVENGQRWLQLISVY